MKNIKAVIGANFGDEGKGLLTDYFASQMKQGIVVRFNGGAQAGHTVTTPDGLRHVFGHIGSGTFSGMPSYLSSFFVVNPMTFNKEIEYLREKGISPKIYIDSDCPVTTPYDMMINQIAEIVRDTKRHGSCGLGFNETINRNLTPEFKLTARELLDEGTLRNRIHDIKNLYTPERLRKLRIDRIPDQYVDILRDESIIESYIDDINHFIEMVTFTDDSILASYDNLLFEGAQGLLLDQSHKYFPHVTRSNTGLKNVKTLIEKAGCEKEMFEVVYVTRAYMTRHGAGPFPTEVPGKPYDGIEDLTNLPNPYQGSLRFGLLDLNILADTISKDLANVEHLKCDVRLGITCLDQLDGEVDYFFYSEKLKTPLKDFINEALNILNVSSGYLSYGPTRETVSPINI